jgi:hypothetical protein
LSLSLAGTTRASPYASKRSFIPDVLQIDVKLNDIEVTLANIHIKGSIGLAEYKAVSRMVPQIMNNVL